MERSHTRYEKSGGTAVLTLARPENRNAITGPEMLSEIIGAIDDAESDATEALDLGILLEVTAHEELAPRARALADLIAAKPAHSVRLAKRLLRQARSMDLDGILELSAALQAISHHTDAHHEAIEEYPWWVNLIAESAKRFLLGGGCKFGVPRTSLRKNGVSPSVLDRAAPNFVRRDRPAPNNRPGSDNQPDPV